jgi:hypothetical protein
LRQAGVNPDDKAAHGCDFLRQRAVAAAQVQHTVARFGVEQFEQRRAEI